LEGRYNESLKHQQSDPHTAELEKQIEEITQEEDWIKLQIDRVYELWALLMSQFLGSESYVKYSEAFEELIFFVLSVMGSKQQKVSVYFLEKIILCMGLLNSDGAMQKIMREYNWLINAKKIRPR
jgi:hypothetical protein